MNLGKTLIFFFFFTIPKGSRAFASPGIAARSCARPMRQRDAGHRLRKMRSKIRANRKRSRRKRFRTKAPCTSRPPTAVAPATVVGTEKSLRQRTKRPSDTLGRRGPPNVRVRARENVGTTARHSVVPGAAAAFHTGWRGSRVEDAVVPVIGSSPRRATVRKIRNSDARTGCAYVKRTKTDAVPAAAFEGMARGLCPPPETFFSLFSLLQ